MQRSAAIRFKDVGPEEVLGTLLNARGWVWGALLATLTIVVYLPALRAGFIWQDDQNITQNALLRDAAGLWRIWTDVSATPRFQPLTYTAYWLAYQCWGDKAVGFHAVSVMLHVANVLLLWALLRRLSVPGAWLAAACFAVHPVQVDAVTWVSRTGMVLSAFFYLAALLVYLVWCGITPQVSDDALGEPVHRFDLRLLESPGLRYSISVLLVAAAVASQPVAVTWPVAVGMIVWWKRGRVSRTDVNALWPFAALAAGGACVALLGFGGGSATGGLPQRLSAAFAGALAVGPDLGLNALKTLVPAPALINFEVDGASFPPIWAWSSLALVVAASAGVWAYRRRLSRAVVAGVVLYCGCNGVASVLDAREAAIGGRGQYLLAAIPLAFAGAVLVRLTVASRVQRATLPWAPATASAAVLSALTAATILVSPRYADAASFWQHRVSNAIGEALAQRRLGDLALARGSAYTAARHYEAALRLTPRDVEATLGLARAFNEQALPDRAFDTLSRALAAVPGDAGVLAALARFEAAHGRHDEAATHFAAALRARPDDALVHNDFALLLAARGVPDEAVAHYRAAIAADPRFLTARINLATTLFQQRRFDEAAEQLQTVVRTDPGNFAAYVNAGAMLAEMKQFAQAERMFRNALALRKDSPEAWNNLGVALKTQGRNSEAAWCFGQAGRVTPPSNVVSGKKLGP